METTSRPPSNFRAPNDPDGNRTGLGAIASPMAVSFREEKLALRTSGPTVDTQPDEMSSATVMHGR